MGSFKLEKSAGAKQEAKTAGAFLAILGVIVGLFVWPQVGVIMLVLGLVFFAHHLLQVSKGKRVATVQACLNSDSLRKWR